MTNISKGRHSSAKLKSMGDHDAFLCRITKSLYYSRLPMTDRLSLPVTEFAAELFTEVKGGLTLERLDIEEAGRISRNACVSPCSLVLALLYLERLKDCNPEYLHKMVASKFLNDDGEEDEVFNMEWAKSGDLTVDRINRLEKDFLAAIDWAIYVQDRDFWDRLRKLETDIAYKEGRKRGWYSYTELSRLMDNVPLAALTHALVSVSSICLAAYAAGLMTLLGSVLVASKLPGTWLVPPSSSGNVQTSDIGKATNLTNSRLVTSDPRDSDDIEENAHISSELLSRQLAMPFNDSCIDCPWEEKKNLTKEYASWEWWLDSMMTWLPEYSRVNEDDTRYENNKKAKKSLRRGTIGRVVENEKLQRTGAYTTNGQSFAHEAYTREAENLIMEINWRETLSSNFDIANKDWRYYATKISVRHGH